MVPWELTIPAFFAGAMFAFCFTARFLRTALELSPESMAEPRLESDWYFDAQRERAVLADQDN